MVVQDQTLEMPQASATVEDPARIEQLSSIVQAYNRVTDNLQKSHEALQGQVARLQTELASADAQLQRSKRLAALGEMAAGIAHEIRNPLAAVQLYASMLVEDLDSTGIQPVERVDPATGNLTIARKIATAVHGLNSIVTDVLSFAREIQPRKDVTRLRPLLDRVIDAHAPAIAHGGVDVNVEIAPVDLTVYADADLLGQAILNLVRNGVDALTGDDPFDQNVTQDQQGRPVLSISASRVDSSIVLRVKDSGPGIDPQDIDRIFNPFFTTRHTGTGLGLAIVHRIVDAHGGSIAVQNDNGAMFELMLPDVADA